VTNGICTCETSEETPNHVFWQCQKFTKERKNLTEVLIKRYNRLPLKVDMILTSMDSSDVYVLRAFVTTLKIKITKVPELTPTTVGNEESLKESIRVLHKIDMEESKTI
jgi:hypothetical protein